MHVVKTASVEISNRLLKCTKRSLVLDSVCTDAQSFHKVNRGGNDTYKGPYRTKTQDPEFSHVIDNFKELTAAIDDLLYELIVRVTEESMDSKSFGDMGAVVSTDSIDDSLDPEAVYSDTRGIELNQEFPIPAWFHD